MLSGLVGLTAIASSDSFRCRWLISTLAGVAAAILGPVWCAAAAVAGTAASAATPSTAPVIIENQKRYMIIPPIERTPKTWLALRTRGKEPGPGRRRRSFSGELGPGLGPGPSSGDAASQSSRRPGRGSG